MIEFAEPTVVKHLNFSYNPLGNATFSKIKRLIENSKSLEQLVLDNVQLSHKALRQLSKGLCKNETMQHLSLSGNNIDDMGAMPLSKIIRDNNALTQLNLHYNSIGSFGGSLIFQALAENVGLLELDLSWNSMSSHMELESSADAISEAFSVNKTLKHIDLSYNRFSVKECELIAEGLTSNHHLLGIHLEGNKATYNFRGYMEMNNDLQLNYE